MSPRSRAALALLLSAGCTQSRPEPAAPTVKIAAAADLAVAFRELGDRFESETGIKPIFSFGSTGLLAKQISEGAPFDVFAAANLSFVDDVVRAKACDATTQSMYARGRIVVWTHKRSKLHPASLADLREQEYVKIAIANPEHAPYGRAAEQALKAAGHYETLKGRLVFGENIQQTMQFADSGNVEAAIVALSLASIAPSGEYFVIDETLHDPIDQAMVICGAVTPAARAFSAFVNGKAGRAVMRRYGFLLPGEKYAVHDESTGEPRVAASTP